MYAREVRELTAYPLVIDFMRSSRIRSLGHTLRSGQVFTENMNGRRPRGRPQTRWKDVVKTDLSHLDVDPDAMEELAEDHSEWKRLVEAVKGLNMPNAP